MSGLAIGRLVELRHRRQMQFFAELIVEQSQMGSAWTNAVRCRAELVRAPIVVVDRMLGAGMD